MPFPMGAVRNGRSGASTASSFIIGGATLNLTTAAIADRNKRAYGTWLPPDEVITNQQELRDRAIAWLRGS